MKALGTLLLLAITAASSTGSPMVVPVLSGQGAADLLGDLNARNARTRRKAVTGLGELGTKDAWEAIVNKALGDPEAQVADEAQIQLGKAPASTALFEALDSKKALGSRTSLVRERAVEALGRIEGSVPLELFVSGLKDKEESVRAAAAYALEQRARRGAGSLDLTNPKAVAGARKTLSKSASSDRDPRARANAIACLAALGVLDEESLERSAKVIARGDKSPFVRAASLVAAGDSNTVADLAAGLGDDDSGVAMVSLRMLHGRGDAASVKALAEALPGASADSGAQRPAVLAAIVASLRDASGLSHGAVRDRWVRWADGLDPDWRRKEAKKKRKAGSDDEAGSTTFYGLRLDSDRLVFLVDMSGSMWKENGDSTRKEQVEVELAKALRGLPESTMFNLIPYASDPGPWEDSLVQATPKNVEKAVKWFANNTQRGRGDLWSALVPVLNDPSVDTVVILFDGAPSGGDRWNVELWRWLLQDQNRFRGVVIHAVMFDASGFLKRAWKDIVGDWGGAQQLID